MHRTWTARISSWAGIYWTLAKIEWQGNRLRKEFLDRAEQQAAEWRNFVKTVQYEGSPLELWTKNIQGMHGAKKEKSTRIADGVRHGPLQVAETPDGAGSIEINNKCRFCEETEVTPKSKIPLYELCWFVEVSDAWTLVLCVRNICRALNDHRSFRFDQWNKAEWTCCSRDNPQRCIYANRALWLHARFICMVE